MIIDRPVRFPGTDEEAEANRNTHKWANDSDSIVCFDCDARLFGEMANYPCGVNPPREVVEIG